MGKLIATGLILIASTLSANAKTFVNWGVSLNYGAPYYGQPMYYQQPVMYGPQQVFYPLQPYNNFYVNSYNGHYHNRMPERRHEHPYYHNTRGRRF